MFEISNQKVLTSPDMNHTVSKINNNKIGIAKAGDYDSISGNDNLPEGEISFRVF